MPDQLNYYYSAVLYVYTRCVCPTVCGAVAPRRFVGSVMSPDQARLGPRTTWEPLGSGQVSFEGQRGGKFHFEEQRANTISNTNTHLYYQGKLIVGDFSCRACLVAIIILL